ncbi:hypothetical protein LCGC14_1084260 [marine sediment metagenome]|uniref:Ribbon-helix-helix protein CopG domain-containing protein n=1 Tax=marine sediment metagenome TaxID=412755 RepID=A0A0F9N1W1_9ZZZZ
MAFNVMGTFSLDTESVTNLNKLSENYKVKKSELVRLFINYFHKNREEFEDLIKKV